MFMTLTKHLIITVVALMACASTAQEGADEATSPQGVTSEPETKASVTAVYGISSDDYLPAAESAKNRLRPQVRGRASRPSLDLPDAFYFIGAPIFLLLFLRVLAIFIREYEEKRKEEMRTVASEAQDVD
ncbi:MAG: hypothetical protein ABFR47_01830 [Verrucomicrobiota bacterium]